MHYKTRENASEQNNNNDRNANTVQQSNFLSGVYKSERIEKIGQYLAKRLLDVLSQCR